MFDTLLIANRGEIACRIAATARRMGLRTVAVYSDVDAHAGHVLACDAAVRIGCSEPRESYLCIDAILAAARASGAQAIHPGYGFLSENAAFAQACADAGLIFVGPPARALAAMGDKSSAKALMQAAGVPVVPGYQGDNQEAAFLQQQAQAIGWPVLIKASSGGGGKGMRVVERAADFAAALASCQREAAASFGNPKVLLERCVPRPRHIEVQVFADAHGHCLHLFERDCSVQRRHQKVLEEAPAPGMTGERRAAMAQAAIAAARAVGYVGAGTVEFIAGQDGRFYFMEMNTRLQVEHPVTEAITGLDLVEWQLRVAAGEALPWEQQDLHIRGHAIEARVYAENPGRDFLPATGTLGTLALPPHSAFAPGPLRIDSAVRQGDTIGPHYDPMIAKVIAHGATRDAARRRLLQGLAAMRATGLATNIAFLQNLLMDAAFATADLDTSLIARRQQALLPAARPAPHEILALAAAARLSRLGLAASGRPHIHPDPWDVLDGWRASGHWQHALSLRDVDGSHRELAVLRQGADWALQVDAVRDDAAQYALRWQATPMAGSSTGLHLRLWLDGAEQRADVCMHGARASIFPGRGVWELEFVDEHSAGDAEDTTGGQLLLAPMPGKITALHVRAGDTVARGDAILTMEAMKMEHTLCAPQDGTVQEICFRTGEQVSEGAQLVVWA